MTLKMDIMPYGITSLDSMTDVVLQLVQFKVMFTIFISSSDMKGLPSSGARKRPTPNPTWKICIAGTDLCCHMESRHGTPTAMEEIF